MPVGADWSTVSIDLAGKCAGVATIDQVTVQLRGGSAGTLLVDDVRILH